MISIAALPRARHHHERKWLFSISWKQLHYAAQEQLQRRSIAMLTAPWVCQCPGAANLQTSCAAVTSIVALCNISSIFQCDRSVRNEVSSPSRCMAPHAHRCLDVQLNQQVPQVLDNHTAASYAFTSLQFQRASRSTVTVAAANNNVNVTSVREEARPAEAQQQVRLVIDFYLQKPNCEE